MRNENLLSFLLIKRRILKLLAIKYAYSLIVLCGISFMACSDDDPVKKESLSANEHPCYAERGSGSGV